MKTFITTVLAAFIFSFSSYAQDTNADRETAFSNFDNSFAGASNVTWSFTEDFTKASFFRDNHKVSVFYNASGEYMATTTQINLDEAPGYLKKAVEKKYPAYTVKETFVFYTDDQTKFFVSLEKDEENIVLEGQSGSVSVYSHAKELIPGN